MPAEASRIVREIEARLGFVPAFYEPAFDDPVLLDGLWKHAVAACVESPLPLLLKEQLFARLARYCSVPYAIVVHSCALHQHRMHGRDVYALLAAPADDNQTDLSIERLASVASPMEGWPPPETDEWRALVECAAASRAGGAATAREALRGALDAPSYNHLVLYLGYVGSALAWIEAHPEISYECDPRALEHLGPLIDEEPRLREFFETYSAPVRGESPPSPAEVNEYQAFIEAIPEFAWKLDAQGNLIFMNRGWSNYTGVRDLGTARRRWLEYVHPDDLPRLAEARNRAVATQEKLDVEYRARAADGTYRAFLARAVPVRDAEGEVTAWYAVATDIEDIRRVERAASQLHAETEAARSLLDTLFARSPVGMVFVDTELRFVRVNAALAAINGHGPDDHIGERVADVVPALWPTLGPVYERVLATREPVLNLEVSSTTPGMPGLRRHWLMNYYPVETAAGELLGVAGVAVEFTARRAAEARVAALYAESRRIADELRMANAAKDEFLGMVSHELKTPITTIYGNARVLLARGHLVPDNARAGALRDIADEADRLRRIIDNLLVLARLESGHVVGREPLLIARMAATLIRDHQQRFPERAVDLDVANDALAPVAAEPLYVEQVLRNLLGNAEKYCGSGTAITVTVTRERDEIAVRVLDRGPGFSAEEAERLFAPFYRSESAAERATGMGVGLSVCKRLIEALNGHIWARRRAGGGAEFGFALPIAFAEDGAET